MNSCTERASRTGPRTRRSSSFRLVAELVLSVGFAALFFQLWPCDVIYDDGAIVLKYMDNFADGHFYAYNPSDGPMYGISGFIHGVLAGLFAWAHLFAPLHSLFASNFIGLVLVSFVSLRILAHFIRAPAMVYPAWLLLMVSAPHFVATVKQGLEVPLHLGIVLGCYYFFLKRRSKWLWLTCVLAMISKADALPVADVNHLVAAALDREWIRTDGRVVGDAVPTVVEGTWIRLENPLSRNPAHILVCAARQSEAVLVKALLYGEEGVKLAAQTFGLPARDPADTVNGLTGELRIDMRPAAPAAFVILTASFQSTGGATDLTLLEPTVVGEPELIAEL